MRDYLSGADFKAASYDKWRKRDLWTLNEAIPLVLGYEPRDGMRHFQHESNRPHSGTLEYISGGIGTQTEFADNYRDLFNLARNAVDVGLLKPHISIIYRAEFEREFNPRLFLEWVQSKDYEVKKELTSLLLDARSVNTNGEANHNDALDMRERNTLLRIIAVLAKDADLDLNHPYAAAETIQMMGANSRVELPKKKDTIANKLKAANDLIKTQ